MKTLVVLWIKWTGMIKTNQKVFFGAAPVIPCQNSSSIMGLSIHRDGRIQISLSYPTTIGPLARIQDRQAYTDIKITSNNKINRIMVSFIDHYNAISIERLPSKTKIGKDSGK